MKHFLPLLVGALAVYGCHTPPPDDTTNAAGPEASPEADGERKEEAHPHGASFAWARRRSADGSVPQNALVRMKDQRDQLLRVQPEMANPVLTNWRWLGPGNVGGRIRGIVIHPTKPNTMWVGSVAGGIWKTTNGGTSWFSLDDFAPVMSVSDLVMDPKNPDKIYAATGEGFFDTVEGTSILAAVRGAGIFVTTNGGTNWTQLASTRGTDFELVNRLTISPADNKILLAATTKGIFRSTDSGKTWSKRSSVNTLDIDFHPTNGKLAVAGSRDGVPRYSTDGGLTWKNATGVPTRQRVEVAYSRSSPATVYAAVSQSNRIHVYRSTNGGQTYSARYTGSGISTWSRYNNIIWVDPTNANVVMVGGVRMFKSTNGGSSFSRSDSGVHPDHHIIVAHPGYNGSTNQTVFNGNDGGIYRTTNVRASRPGWRELNNNLGITQFYGAAVSPTGTVVGGTQDNGTLLYTGNKEGWVRKIGGDGCFCAADPTDSRFLYGQIYWIRIYRSTNGGSSFRSIATSRQIPDAGSNFIPYILLDPNNTNRMYFCGAGLWRSDDIKNTLRLPAWRQVKARISPCTGLGGSGIGSGSGNGKNAHFRQDPRCNISTVAVAPGDSKIVWVGHNHGDLYRSTNGTSTSPTWTKVDVKAQPDRWVSHIVIDPRDNKRVYVSFMGYHADNVWRTTDSGANWTRITGTGSTGLPSAPVSALAVHPVIPGCLFAGTDIGLFYSVDDGKTWLTTKAGASTSPIDELIWKDNRTLMVVTHGRGIFLVDVGTPATASTAGTGCGRTTKPVLVSSVPVVGKALTLAMTSGSNGAPVSLLLSAGPPKPTNVGPGCTAQVDLGSLLLLPAGRTDSSGIWRMTFKMPPARSLIGLVMTAQNIIFVTGGPALGIGELSNGIQLRGGL